MTNSTKALQKHAAANGEKSKSKRCAEKFFGSYFFRYTAIYLVLSAIIFTQFLFFRKSHPGNFLDLKKKRARNKRKSRKKKRL